MSKRQQKWQRSQIQKEFRIHNIVWLIYLMKLSEDGWYRKSKRLKKKTTQTFVETRSLVIEVKSAVASLLVQWLRLGLAAPGPSFSPWPWKTPRVVEQLGLRSGARRWQLGTPTRLGPVLCNRRGRQRRSPAPRWESPAHHKRRKRSVAAKTRHSRNRSQ